MLWKFFQRTRKSNAGDLRSSSEGLHKRLDLFQNDRVVNGGGTVLGVALEYVPQWSTQGSAGAGFGQALNHQGAVVVADGADMFPNAGFYLGIDVPFRLTGVVL